MVPFNSTGHHSNFRRQVLRQVLAIPMPNLRSQLMPLSGVSQVLSPVLLAPPLLLQSPTQKRPFQFPRIHSAKPAFAAHIGHVFVKTRSLDIFWRSHLVAGEAAKPARPPAKPARIFRASTDKTCARFVSISAANWHAAARHSKKKACTPGETRGKFAISACLF